MPNYVTNNLKVFGTTAQIKAFRDAVRDPSAKRGDDVFIFDFNRVVPMPTELRGTVSPMRIISEAEYKAQEARLARGELTDIERMMGSPSRSLTKELSDLYKSKYGTDNWYDWACENWGVKWNAGSCSHNGTNGDSIHFETAWAHPEPLFSNMSKRFPDLAFICSYADEDMGSNCGLSAYRNGVFQHMSAQDVGSDFALAFAFVVKYGAGMEDAIAQWVADDCMTKAKANTIRKHAMGDHPMMKIAREMSFSSIEYPVALDQATQLIESK